MAGKLTVTKADNTSVLQTENPSEEAIQLASLSYRLIKILSENETSQNQRVAKFPRNFSCFLASYTT